MRPKSVPEKEPATLASEHRLPAVYAWRYFVTDGGLMSYGVDLVDVYRQSASYVDRFLRGTKPAPPSSMRNSRRFIIRSPRRRGREPTVARRGQALSQS